MYTRDPWKCKTCDVQYPRYVTPRLALQTLGTEWGRTLFEDIWVDTVLREIKNSDQVRWVIPDVRFKNEVRKLSDSGVPLVRLLRGEQRFAHPSEAEMSEMGDDLFNFVLDNRSSLDHLYGLADDVVRKIGCK